MFESVHAVCGQTARVIKNFDASQDSLLRGPKVIEWRSSRSYNRIYIPVEYSIMSINHIQLKINCLQLIMPQFAKKYTEWMVEGIQLEPCYMIQMSSSITSSQLAIIPGDSMIIAEWLNITTCPIVSYSYIQRKKWEKRVVTVQKRMKKTKLTERSFGAGDSSWWKVTLAPNDLLKYNHTREIYFINTGQYEALQRYYAYRGSWNVSELEQTLRLRFPWLMMTFSRCFFLAPDLPDCGEDPSLTCCWLLAIVAWRSKKLVTKQTFRTGVSVG